MKMKEWFTDESKWIKGAYYCDKLDSTYENIPENLKSCCLVGAAKMCYPNIDVRDKVYEKIRNYINKDRKRLITYFDWNDSDYTTFEDIKKLVNELDI